MDEARHKVVDFKRYKLLSDDKMISLLKKEGFQEYIPIRDTVISYDLQFLADVSEYFSF